MEGREGCRGRLRRLIVANGLAGVLERRSRELVEVDVGESELRASAPRGGHQKGGEGRREEAEGGGVRGK